MSQTYDIERTKIIVVVSGGAVTEVYASNEYVDVEILDKDVQEARFERHNRDLSSKIKDMEQVY